MSVLPLRTQAAGAVHEQTDAVLLEGIVSGDERAFEELFARHYSAVYGVVLRIVGDAQEAEEVALDAFLKLYLRPDLGHDANVRGWLLRVAINAAFNSVRARRRRFDWLRRFAQRREARATGDDPSEIVERRDEAERLRSHLALLPERQRTVLILRAAGMSYLEIAAAIGVRVSSVGTILTRAERELRMSWERNMGLDGGKDDEAP